MIDALEVTIRYLTAAGLPASGQIAARHRYGEAWTIGTPALVLAPDGGTPERYIPVQNVRLEARAYALSPYVAITMLEDLIALSRSTSRRPVELVDGRTGLLYSILQASGPSLLYDEDLKMDFALMFFDVKVAEQPL